VLLGLGLGLGLGHDRASWAELNDEVEAILYQDGKSWYAGLSQFAIHLILCPFLLQL
jgi:hypothetical protein